MSKKYLTIALFAMVVLTAVAVPRTKQQMRQAASEALQRHAAGMRMAQPTGELKELKSTDTYSIMSYDASKGFAVVSADDVAPALLGVSLMPYSNGANEGLNWFLSVAERVIQTARTSGVPLTTTAPDPGKFPSDVGPLMTTTWDQQEPYWNMLPKRGGRTVLTGCVATAMAQVLYYFKTPVHGQGTYSNSSSGTTITVNYDESYYDWDNMLEHYNPGQYNETQANAVALLMRDCGVAADMQYAPDGSGTFSENAAAGLRRNFGIDEAVCVKRDEYTEPEWMELVYKNLSEAGPVYYGGDDLRPWVYGGHAFVLDGYRADGMVSVNWGWSGEDNGFYNIALLNPSGYQFDSGQDMIIGVYGNGHHNDERPALTDTVTVSTPGTLEQILNRDSLLRYGNLTVRGELNAADLVTLRHMGGIDVRNRETQGRLSTLDLSGASFGSDVLPAKAFLGANKIRSLTLPAGLTKFGSQSMSNMSSLRLLRIYGQTVPTTEYNTFVNTEKASCTVFVPSGMQNKYSRQAAWSGFMSIVEFGTAVKAVNTLREYGEENPEWRYTISGDLVFGQPELSCEATVTSPVGKYPIYVNKGTLMPKNANMLMLKDGFLIVDRAPLTIKGDTLTREAGQPNPVLTFTCEGLKNGEQADSTVFSVMPVLTCVADTLSPAGDYKIELSVAETYNYSITYVPGVLRVLEASGISDVRSAASVKAGTYDLQGRRVNGDARRSGIYVRQGRKVVLR